MRRRHRSGGRKCRGARRIERRRAHRLSGGSKRDQESSKLRRPFTVEKFIAKATSKNCKLQVFLRHEQRVSAHASMTRNTRSDLQHANEQLAKKQQKTSSRQNESLSTQNTNERRIYSAAAAAAAATAAAVATLVDEPRASAVATAAAVVATAAVAIAAAMATRARAQCSTFAYECASGCARARAHTSHSTRARRSKRKRARARSAPFSIDDDRLT